MPHFFIKSANVKDNSVSIFDKDTYNHIAKSLRARTGESILLIDENKIQYEGKIIDINSHSIEINILKSYKSKMELEFKLYLAQSPLRSDSQNSVIEKATELGVEGIYPIFTDNCAVKKSVIEQKISKWQKIMFEASKQCERAKIPTCFNVTLLDEIALCSDFDRVFAFTERSADFKLKSYLKQTPVLKDEKILAIIGPEGGFSQKEFDFFKEKNIVTISLGELILKADTAVVTALGNIIYEYE